MAVIAEIDSATTGQAAPTAWDAVLTQVRAHLEHTGAHPARTVVLVPFAQLMGEAARQWARRYPDGFAPRFETTRNWAAQLAEFTPGPHDLAQARGRDLLGARDLLEAAGLGARQALLAGPLVDCANQLAAVAASVPQALRADWAERARRAVPTEGDGWLATTWGEMWFTVNGGERWRKLTGESGFALRGLHLLDRQHGWFVGDGGTILKLATERWPVQEEVLLPSLKR